MLLDFHLHTWHSDGLLPPAQLLAAVRRAGVTAFAVTDHDSLAGFRSLYGLTGVPGLVPGVEITAEADAREVHIVGLGIDPHDAGLATFLSGIRARREERLRILIERLPAKIGAGLSLEDLRAGDGSHAETLTRNHLARALVRHGRVGRERDAFAAYLGDEHTVVAGLPPYPAPDAATAAIRAAGGVAILAHPGVYGELSTITSLLDRSACDGLEVRHPQLDAGLAAALDQLAISRNLFASAGSDLHFLGARRPGMCPLPADRWRPLCERLGVACE